MKMNEIEKVSQAKSHPVGYRNSEYYGSGVHNIYDIIEYEINELKNEDIPDYLMRNFSYKPKNGVSTANEVKMFLKRNFPSHKYGLWLASKEAAAELYGGTPDNTEMYVIPDSAIIISDLGYDGFLVVSEERLESNIDE